jgi:hypothetical protein
MVVEQFFCTSCDASLHAKGARQRHVRAPAGGGVHNGVTRIDTPFAFHVVYCTREPNARVADMFFKVCAPHVADSSAPPRMAGGAVADVAIRPLDSDNFLAKVAELGADAAPEVEDDRCVCTRMLSGRERIGGLTQP